MPHIDSNIPQNILYSTIKKEFLRTARPSTFPDGFIPKSKELLNRMEPQGSESIPTKRALRKIFL